MIFIGKHPMATIEMMGFIPSFLSDDDPRPAKEQLNSGYAFAGGWDPFKGFTMDENENLLYPGDPPQRPLCEIYLREERIVLYPCSWVAIIQPDKSYEVCRMD